MCQGTNVPDIQATPSCNSYFVFTASFEFQSNTYEIENTFCKPVHTSDDAKKEIFKIEDHITDHIKSNSKDATKVASIPQSDDIMASSNVGEFLRAHYRLGYLSFARLKLLAKLEIIPKRLQHAKPPMCTAYLFGKMCRRNWRTRAKNRRRIIPANRSGAVMSVDQMEFSTTANNGTNTPRYSLTITLTSPSYTYKRHYHPKKR